VFVEKGKKLKLLDVILLLASHLLATGPDVCKLGINIK